MDGDQYDAYLVPLTFLAVVLIIVGVVVLALAPGVGLAILGCGGVIIAFLRWSSGRAVLGEEGLDMTPHEIAVRATSYEDAQQNAIDRRLDPLPVPRYPHLFVPPPEYLSGSIGEEAWKAYFRARSPYIFERNKEGMRMTLRKR
jgi:hypothetical protein